MDYAEFIESKAVKDPDTGFLVDRNALNEALFDFQRDIVSWALQLWSTEGDVVLSPFMGIGSEGYESIKLGRKFIGFELKESYFNQACKNIELAEEMQQTLI